MTPSGISPEDLAALEAKVSAALRSRDHSGLDVLGFGEISIALGHPAGEPRHVCKRTPPLTVDQFDAYRRLVDRYIAELRSLELRVVDTEVLAVERVDGVIGYLIQPLLGPETLGHNVLGSSEPDPDHPLLAALGATLSIVSPELSIDAQVTNWSWDGTTLSLLDVGTPFLWDDDRFTLDMSPYLPMISAPLRGAVRRDLTKMVERWREPRGVVIDVVANLMREGLDQWVEPTITALNRSLPPGAAVHRAEAEAAHREDVKTWPRLTRLKRIERAWQTAVRRRPYDFFIQTTFDADKTY